MGPEIPPAPVGASAELVEALSSVEGGGVGVADVPVPSDAAGWRELVAAVNAPLDDEVRGMVESLPVSLEAVEVAGVPVWWVTPDEVAAEREGQLFVHVHGGGYLLGGGLAAAAEAILFAVEVGVEAVSIDYRMPPDHPFPAAVDDVMAVWEALLGERAAGSMWMGGTSAGGGLTLNALQRCVREGVDVPGAAFVGTPGSDLSLVGDSLYTCRGVDRNIPTLDGMLEAMFVLYADGRPLDDPLISAVYGDFEGFPPTLLVTGVRDLFLSNTVRAHIKIRQAGGVADLLVYEGVSHGDYLHEVGTPEGQHFMEETRQFLDAHLRRSRRRRAPKVKHASSANQLSEVVGDG